MSLDDASTRLRLAELEKALLPLAQMADPRVFVPEDLPITRPMATAAKKITPLTMGDAYRAAAVLNMLGDT